MTRPDETLGRIADAVRGRFEAERRVLSFEEYVALVEEHPWRYSRDAARYVRDCFDHFGHEEVARPDGVRRRWRLFDLPFAAPDQRAERLAGHEDVQNAVYTYLSSFVREGRANRLVLLHGPNGSAKTTFVQVIMRALEAYSAMDEGALYCFSWIFPRGRDGKSIGFGSTDEVMRAEGSFAHLAEGRIDAKLASELREHPLLLLPTAERRALLSAAYERHGLTERPPHWLWNGDLGHKNRQIADALLTAYRGDLRRVLAHVQVERYHISKRYRRGAVTIGPQMAVDANERQITADQTLGSLPASLAALRLFESYGELVDASGGLLEYSDLLKRPLDAWRYLLIAIETGEVSLHLSNLALNAVMIASSNEPHLNAFKEHPEYNSFRGRLHLVRVPYLRDYRDEQAIYDAQIVPQVRRHVAPHTTFVAALWAVLTRLRRARPDAYPDAALGRIAADLTPLEKADLYADGTTPRRLSSDDAAALRGGIDRVAREWETAADYEGLSGASPREIRAILLAAAEDQTQPCLSPAGVLEHVAAFCRRNDYEFLRDTPDRGYSDHRGFVEQVEQRWLDRVDDELRAASGLVDEARYRELLDRYVAQVNAWVKREQVLNRVTGAYESPDLRFMAGIEESLGATDAEEFRRNVIGTIAAFALDHPGTAVDNAAVFPRYLERLRDAYYAEHRKRLDQLAEDVFALAVGSKVSPDRQADAEAVAGRLRARFGYEDTSLQVALGALLRARAGRLPI